ncbi:MAG: sodium/proline symporter [Lachnospiraceae bacterium]|nr:sodium/proline symporter [Lachnospiraceae bacterium]
MTNSQIVMLIAMAVYLLGIVFVGFVLSSQNETMGDFYLGGRKLGPFVSAMSAEASDMSSWLLMGLPGVAYLTGVADAGWTAIGLALGTYLNWLIVAKRLRRYTEKTNSITVPTYFSNRYKDEKGVLTLLGALIIIVFFVPYTASGFAACGKLFGSLFGIDYHLAMVVSAIVIILYTSMGGFLAASLTDFIQSIVMSLALIIILVFGVTQAGGMEAVMENARTLPGYLGFTSTYDAASGAASPYSALTIVSTLAWGLGYFGMPHILLRFMAIQDDHKIKLSRRIASVWVVISMAAAVLIGIVGLGMSEAGAITLLQGSQSETIIVEIAQKLAQNGVLTALIAGIVLSGILASTMSTADSQLLAASSSVSNDILVNVFHLDMDQKNLLRVSRISLLIIAVLGMFFAWDANSSVFQIVSFAWAGFGAAFGPVVLLSLFWRRSNKQGAVAGLLAGGIMVFVWKFAVRPMGGILNIYELLPAFLVAIAVNVIVSLATPAPDREITATFDAVNKMK